MPPCRLFIQLICTVATSFKVARDMFDVQAGNNVIVNPISDMKS